MGEIAAKLGDMARRMIDYRMIWRWHFYAGLVCIPFIVVLSITGPIYLFKPQIEAAIDARYDHLAFTAPVRPAADMIAAAEHAVPGGRFKAIEVRPDDHDAARIIVQKGGDKIRVYVHPQDLSILKQVPEDSRFMNVVKTIHGELFAGRFGQVIVELAASWAIVMVLSGLYLGWPRQATGLAGVLWPRLNMGRRIFWRDIHAVAGIYISGLALFLLLTGLPWTYVWGNGFKAVRSLGQPPAAQAWSQGRHDEHQSAKAEGTKPADLTQLDAMIDMVRALNVPPPVILSAPAKGILWKVTSDSGNRPQRFTLTLEPTMLEVIGREDFADKNLLDRIVGVGTAAHEGQLFGWPNQLLGLVTALGLLTLCVTGVIMWWQRRPERTLGAPVRLPDERLGPGLAILTVVLAIFLPVLGISLVIVAVVERLVLRRITVARDWLGLSA